MGLFSSNESDAIKQINKMNSCIFQIRQMIRLTDDTIVSSNAGNIAIILNECSGYYTKYEKIKSGMGSFNESLFMGATVDCWNGERIGVFQWEHYFKNTFHMLIEGIKSVS